jgi:hypothetical protein
MRTVRHDDLLPLGLDGWSTDRATVTLTEEYNPVVQTDKLTWKSTILNLSDLKLFRSCPALLSLLASI